MPDGFEILFFEEGEPIVDGDPGDLKFKIKTAPDQKFQREGNNLYLTYFIDLIDALVARGFCFFSEVKLPVWCLVRNYHLSQ